jgi:hypothetical protein
MIRDLVIIKDGVPLFSKSLSDLSIFSSKMNDLILLSGFFSALNSFSDQFEDLGAISELKLTNNNLKMSFLRDTQIQNMIYLATFDENSNSVDIKKFLRTVSNMFLKKYGIENINNWNGRSEAFKSFENMVEEIAKEDTNKDFQDFNKKEIEVTDNSTKKTKDQEFSEQNGALLEIKHQELCKKKSLDYLNFIPSLKLSKNVNPKYYLTGDLSLDVFNEINGNKTILEIAKDLNINPELVFNICKNLIKFGFVKLIS